jgi:hypothetical protein
VPARPHENNNATTAVTRRRRAPEIHPVRRILVVSLCFAAVAFGSQLTLNGVSGAPMPASPRPTALAAHVAASPRNVCPVVIEPLTPANQDGAVVAPSSSGACPNPSAATPGTGATKPAAASQTVTLEIEPAPH